MNYPENCTACGTRLRFEDADTITEADDIRASAYVELPRLRDALRQVRSYCPNAPTGHPADAAFDRIIGVCREALRDA